MRRRRPRASWALLALSVSLGVAVTATLQDHLEALEARARAGGDTVPVAVAARPLTRGTRIKGTDLATGEMPEAFLPPAPVAPGAAVG
ncbi:MAG TPA: SAF domain-containing protein, partial [Actinomycetota bacterium]|nr:SAF domain-containing protein [Actinomycetota bacterium]